MPYYFSQLSGDEQIIYNQIYRGLCSYAARIAINKVPQKKACKLYEAVLEDHPELSVVDCTQINWEVSVTGMQLLPGYWFPESQIYQNHMLFLEECEFIVNNLVDVNMDDLTKAIVIHDFICRNIKYGYCNAAGMAEKLSQSAFSTLFERIGVCKGISTLYKCLLDLAGVETIVVTGENCGTGNWESHAWNMVRINGEYSHVDVTMDVTGFASTGHLSHFGMNFTDSDASCNYRWDTQRLPTCRTSMEGYFECHRKTVSNAYELQNYVKKMVSTGAKTFSFKVVRGSELACKDERELCNDILEYLVQFTRKSVQVKYIYNEQFKRMMIEVV